MHPDGREADSAGWAARREERDVVVPPERRATPQHARRVASPLKKSDVRIRFALPTIGWGFGAQQRICLMRVLQMIIRFKRGSRLHRHMCARNAAHEDA